MSTNDFWQEIELSVLPGEEVLLVGQPNAAKITKAGLVGTFMLCLFIFPMLLLLPLFWWFVSLGADRHRFYVTNQRVIVTNGLFGYQTRSVPLERVSDVSIGCSWIERWIDIRTVTVRDMTGEVHTGAQMRGLENAPEVQELILTEVRRVNRAIDAKPAIQASAQAANSGSGDGDGAESPQHQRARMIELLERIESKVGS